MIFHFPLGFLRAATRRCLPGAAGPHHIRAAGLEYDARTAAADGTGDLQSTADAIHTALTMTEEQKETAWQKLFAVGFIAHRNPTATHTAPNQRKLSGRHRRTELTMQYVSKYTAEAWGVSFVNECELSVYLCAWRMCCLLARFASCLEKVSKLTATVTRLSGAPPSGPMIPGRKKSGSLSRTSSRASMMRRSSGRNGSFHSVREGSISGVIP